MKIIKGYIDRRLNNMFERISENSVDNLVENFKEEALEVYTRNNYII
ncbi:hypothetical protein Marpi_0937 [Marinitoga piezophila KA3]|uniref:Uncharacterized protein n=1 Tax=Marinitoga piezophila (strain DSM 14283 / JCM 11233 / KA3) TaxID=443254 RepID=H2J7K9_MARPK|nr:hypothetical protein [Marinitoga piezophila]AEX85350.1 hypothetical protein Marpi_0937 [Marinitoga piezophila KA3]